MTRTITVVGLGAGDLAQLPLGSYRQLKEADRLFVRTEDHPVLDDLKEEGLQWESFDAVYEENDRFSDVYGTITASLFDHVLKGDLVYAVPGHPLVAEETVQRLLSEQEKNNVKVNIQGGQSFLDPVFASLKIDPIEGFQLVDGTALNGEELELRHHMVICQVYDTFVASEVKLTLMEHLPDDYPVTVVTAAGSSGEKLAEVPLFELDRVTGINNLTAVYVPPVKDEALLTRDFARLREVIATLRGPGGCPWDQKQTHESLKPFLIEEAYEVIEAIDAGDDDHLAEELGDVLLQVMLHAQIGEDSGFFTISDVIGHITEKMVRRHPHVFAEAEADTADSVVTQWEEIKKTEKGETGKGEGLLDSIPASLPGLLRAYKVQKKAAKAGFDWPDEAPMHEKLREELTEWEQELASGNTGAAAEEFGDVLFTIVNLARYHKIDPEEALRRTNNKFIRRFRFIEETVAASGLSMEDQTLDQLDALWEEAKEQGL
ncbi:nucleoside triphosphate pyrophosphohydrolase [Alteribacter natronophilus]|uniref:nucleoside triphosphate pyrophosphohydrolase n=1 Tax=Alteribacter natronophilus TaxID=2583810 RepID=UPI00110DE0F9|nr:nucleoside triphosphate pyrophosphohydrolase [Alteribacter natronophilus]TMW69951.1 nucleoside triphosphate pyrophosphohydrolase [Alteribacter natronophilus]